jgi:hypothetical protein
MGTACYVCIGLILAAVKDSDGKYSAGRTGAVGRR